MVDACVYLTTNTCANYKLQNFLPTQPFGLLLQSDSGQHPPESNGIGGDD